MMKSLLASALVVAAATSAAVIPASAAPMGVASAVEAQSDVAEVKFRRRHVHIHIGGFGYGLYGHGHGYYSGAGYCDRLYWRARHTGSPRLWRIYRMECT